MQGLVTLHPFHSDRLILNPAGLAGVLTVLHLCMDLKNTLLDKHHYMLFYITAAMNPRMLMTVGGGGGMVLGRAWWRFFVCLF